MNEKPYTMLTITRPQAPAPVEARLAGPAQASRDEVSTDTQEVMQIVLRLLRERMGMDVVFVSPYAEGARRIHGDDAGNYGSATPTAIATDGTEAALAAKPLSTPVILRDGRLYGMLCCMRPEDNPLIAERDLRSLRYSAQLAARLLDNLQVLRDLNRRALRH